MRDAVASKPDGDKAVASTPEGDKAVASKPDGDKAVASKPDGDKAVASTPDGDKAHPALANLRVAFDSIRDQETAGPLPDSLCGQLWDSLHKHLDGETPSSTPHAWEMILEA